MVVQGIAVFMVVLLFAFIYANWPAVKAELAYSRIQKQVAPTTQPTATPTLAPVTTVTPEPTPSPAPIVESPHIVISKIGVDTPINWQVPAERTLDYLTKGVAHLAGSATLGQIGNVFITGHSSDYTWNNNPYAAAFALLPKLAVGDTIQIKENGKTFEYKVANTKIVAADNVEITRPTTTPVLTLMTCYPIGTTRERYIVQAALTSSPTQLTATTQADSTALPEIKFR